MAKKILPKTIGPLDAPHPKLTMFGCEISVKNSRNKTEASSKFSGVFGKQHDIKWFESVSLRQHGLYRSGKRFTKRAFSSCAAICAEVLMTYFLE
jgi:hypothetical protein